MEKAITKSCASNTQLARLAERALPALSGDSVNYDTDKNTFYTAGYTSATGNTYYKTYRLSDSLCISCSLGQGHRYTFLNGLSIFGWDGQKSRLLGLWSSPSTTFFSDYAVEEVAMTLVKDYLASRDKLSDATVPDS